MQDTYKGDINVDTETMSLTHTTWTRSNQPYLERAIPPSILELFWMLRITEGGLMAWVGSSTGTHKSQTPN